MGFENSAIAPGTVFGRDFRIVSALKTGGMGAVYIAQQLSTGKHRALKIMNADIAQDPATRERFVLEARAASQIDSDHVVEVVTAGVDEATGTLYLVMELLRGEELEDALARLGPLPAGDVGEVLLQVGHALERAHAMGIVHRDLKLQNIFLAASRRKDAAFTAKILDFGVAKLVLENQNKTTQALGSPLFMAPEQTDSKGRITPGSDVWALGLITFRLLTGHDFWRETGSLPMLLREIVVDPIPFASERARELGMPGVLPVGFDAWFARCVNRNIDARFPEAGACVRAFVELLEPNAPAGKLAVSVPTGTGHSWSASLPASALVGSAVQNHSFATAPASQVVSGHSLPPAERASLENSKTAGISDQAMISTDSQAKEKPTSTPFPKAVFLVVPVVLGAIVAAAVFLQAKPQAPAGSGTPASTQSVSQTATATTTASAAAPAQTGCPAGMVSIPGGAMFMGARDLIAAADAKPPHRVILSDYCLDKTEVTAADYQRCVDGGTCERALDHVSWPNVTEAQKKKYSGYCNASAADRANHPINCVAWAMADTYCKQKGYSLPTEAQWEYAARGSSQKKYPWGDEPAGPKLLNACGSECADHWKKAENETRKTMFEGDDGHVGTAPVGSYPAGASTQGVLDLAGNVWEWTADYYAPYSETDSQNPPTDPKGPTSGEKRVVRGGDYLGAEPDWSRPSYRWKTDPDTYNHAIGFRCAKNLKP